MPLVSYRCSSWSSCQLGLSRARLEYDQIDLGPMHRGHLPFPARQTDRLVETRGDQRCSFFSPPRARGDLHYSPGYAADSGNPSEL